MTKRFFKLMISPLTDLSNIIVLDSKRSEDCIDFTMMFFVLVFMIPDTKSDRIFNIISDFWWHIGCRLYFLKVLLELFLVIFYF